MKKLWLTGIFSGLFLMVVLSGCGGSSGGGGNNGGGSTPAVYVGGYYTKSETPGVYTDTACYWDAGGRHDLDGNGSMAFLL